VSSRSTEAGQSCGYCHLWVLLAFEVVLKDLNRGKVSARDMKTGITIDP